MGGGPGMGVSVGTEPQVTVNECGAKFTRAFDNSFPHPRVTQLAGRPTPGRRSCNQHCCLRGQTKQSPGRSLGWAVAEAGPWSCRAPPSGAPAILLPAHLPPNTREAWASCLARPSRGDHLPGRSTAHSHPGQGSRWRCSHRTSADLTWAGRPVFSLAAGSSAAGTLLTPLTTSQAN